jgi:aminobenzoyl-glutamate utilization protein B
MVKETALSWIDENQKKIIEVSDKAWEYAEVGLLENKTSKLLADWVERQGFQVERGVADMPTAFVATWSNGKGPTIGLLGELDALAGLSQKTVPYKEPVKEGAPGHGCGHNIHGTTAMAAGVAMKAAMEEKKLSGTIKIYGCPAEETLVGKVWLTRHGLFKGVDACISHHPGSSNTAGTGSSNALNSFKVHFYGRTSHAAGDPENGISALDGVELMSNGVNFMREHIIEKARVHYVTEVGGGQPNVVPAYARVWYYTRSPEREQVEYIYNWVLQIADGADKMARTTHKIEFLTGCYNVLPNKPLSDLIVKNMREVGAPEHDEKELEFAKEMNKSVDPRQKKEGLRKSKRPGWEKLVDELFDERILDDYQAGEIGAGSTDVADVSWVTPTKEFSTVCCMLGTPGHSWQFASQSGMSIGHKGLMFASKTMACTGLDLLTKPKMLREIKSEFKTRLQGRKYKPPIPLDLNPPLKQF